MPGVGETHQHLVDEVQGRHQAITRKPTLAQAALDDQLARVAQYDYPSGAGPQARALVGRPLALDLVDEDGLESNDGTDNIQCMKRYASLKGDARELRVCLPELVLVGLDLSRLQAARPT